MVFLQKQLVFILRRWKAFFYLYNLARNLHSYSFNLQYIFIELYEEAITWLYCTVVNNEFVYYALYVYFTLGMYRWTNNSS